MLFENGEREFIFIAAKCSGNPVRIRNGCATVTGYKLPEATVSFAFGECREGGSEVQARSQDTGLVALVVVVHCERPTSPQREGWGQPVSRVRDGISLKAFILRFCGV